MIKKLRWEYALSALALLAPGLVQVASANMIATVPEPGSLALFGAGLLGFGWMMWRRRRRAGPRA